MFITKYTFLLTIPECRTELGKQDFLFSTYAAWNHFQTDVQLYVLILTRLFKYVVKGLKANTI